MKLFRDWFIGHFLSYAPGCRPLLLLLDGHSSYFCPEMIRAAAAEGVILFTLPPHTTNLLIKVCLHRLRWNGGKQCKILFQKIQVETLQGWIFLLYLRKRGIKRCHFRTQKLLFE